MRDRTTLTRLLTIVATLALFGTVLAQAKPAQKPVEPPKTAEAPAKVEQAPVKPDAPKTEKAKAPDPVTDVDKLTGQNLILSLQLAQAKRDAAQAAVERATEDFERARVDLTTLVAKLQKDGYDLNLQTWTYTVKPLPTPPIK